MKPEFGNLEHIKILEKGIMCVCGHSKGDHWSEGCNKYDKDGKEVWCECECGDNHIKIDDCGCEGFKIDPNPPPL